jgi:hypothetical protein
MQDGNIVKVKTETFFRYRSIVAEHSLAQNECVKKPEL